MEPAHAETCRELKPNNKKTTGQESRPRHGRNLEIVRCSPAREAKRDEIGAPCLQNLHTQVSRRFAACPSKLEPKMLHLPSLNFKSFFNTRLEICENGSQQGPFASQNLQGSYKKAISIATQTNIKTFAKIINNDGPSPPKSSISLQM